MMVYHLAFVVAMITAASYDLAKRRVPNVLNVATLLMGLCAQLSFGGWRALGLGLAGAGLGLALLLLPFKGGWMAGGDVKLAAAIGAWLGPFDVVAAILYGLAGGGLLALVRLASGGAALRRRVLRNLKIALYTRGALSVEQRPRSQSVPLAVGFAVSAAVIFVTNRGLHV